jgi:hypothetical protein
MPRKPPTILVKRRALRRSSCRRFGVYRSSLAFEVPQRSLVHLCAETCSYVTAEKTIKVVPRHTLLTRCLVKDRADIAFTEYLYHSRPLHPLSPKTWLTGNWARLGAE